MIYLALAISLVLFVWGLKRSCAIERAANALLLAKTSMATLRDRSRSDEEKERAARAAAGRLFLGAAAILARLGLALAAPAAFLGLLVAARLVSLGSVAQALESWVFLAVSAAVMTAALAWRR